MAASQPLPRSRHAAVNNGSNMMVWGGYSVSTKVKTSTLEIFDVTSLTFNQPRNLHGCDMPEGLFDMAVTSDGETSFSFGGRSGPYPFTYHNTLFQITLSKRLCRELQATSPSHTVPERKSGSCVVQFDDRLVLHGGYTGQRWTNELHVFDLGKRAWVAQPTTGEAPPPLAWHTFTKIDHHRAVVFGGGTKSSTNDTYMLDMETWHWTKVTTSGGQPPARHSHATCCIAGPLTGQQYPLLMVMGGQGAEWKLFGDVWLLDVDKGVWCEVTLPVAITPRCGHSATIFSSGPRFRVVVLFGGQKAALGNIISETTLLLLELRGGSWQVTRVVEPDELGRPDESLIEQMRKLELSPQEELQTQSTGTDGASSPTSPIDTSLPTHSADLDH